jgi:hypothetical protein
MWRSEKVTKSSEKERVEEISHDEHLERIENDVCNTHGGRRSSEYCLDWRSHKLLCPCWVSPTLEVAGRTTFASVVRVAVIGRMRCPLGLGRASIRGTL